MKTLPKFAAVVALGAAFTTTSSAFGQADLQLRQAREREAAQKREQRQEQRQERQADRRENRQERRELRKEREQLGNMPDPVRKTLRAETQNASNVDYFRVPAGDNKDAPQTFGATFTKADDGHHYDIRVDRQGNVIERTDITALHTAQAAGQDLRKEREQLGNMPDPVRKTLQAETHNASNVDYFRVPAGDNKDAPQTFGATFTKADNGHHYDIRVDRQGNVVARTDITALHAAQAAAKAPGQAPATPAPAPGTQSERAEAPESGDPMYRRLQANEVPQNIRTVLDREARGGEDVKYYRSKYGTQTSYTVRFDKGGEEQAVHVSDEGTVLARGGEAVNTDEAQTAGASSNAEVQTGRVELNAIPQQAQTQIRRLSEGGTDVKYYATKYGNQQAYQASFTKNGQEQRVIVDANGKILSQR